MKITEIHDIDEDYGKGSLTVMVENDVGETKRVDIYAGEPEDALFFRDLSGAYDIADLVKMAYEAGKRGESLEYEFIDENDESEDE